jgi:phage-related protein (TIGR01555 family)
MARKRQKKARAQQNDAGTFADSWRNAITKLGQTGDKSTHTRFGPGSLLDDTTLEDLYTSNKLAARIIDRLPDDATREQIEIIKADEEIDEKSLRSWLEDLEALTMFGDGWRWARLFGGALIVMAVNDGLPFEMPLDLKKARGIAGLSVVDKRFVQPDILDPGLGSRGFGNPQHYEIFLPFGRNNTRKIHRSRVIRFDSYRLPPFTLAKNGGWAPSILDRIYTTLRRLGTVRGYSENIIHHVSLMLLKMAGLRKQLAGGEKSRSQVKEDLDSIKEAMDSLHLLAIDAADDFSRNESTALTGLKDLLERFLDDLVSETDMPRSLLLGETPGGLNTGENAGETRAWFDHVRAQQKLILTPRINQLLTVLFSIERNAGRAAPTEWQIDYASLWQMNENEAADIRTKNAQSDTAYWTMGSLSSGEIRKSRFLDGNQGDILLEEEDLETPPEEPEVPEEEEGEEVPEEDDLPPPRPMPSDASKLEKAHAIAERLGISPSTVISLFKKNQIKGWRLPNGQYRFLMEEVMEALDDGTSTP